MPEEYLPADLGKAHTYSAYERPTKVDQSKLARVCLPNPALNEFLDSLPGILKAEDLRAIIQAVIHAYHTRKPVVVGIGGHVVKCGISPLLIALMEKGVITALAMNGGASIHDFELATLGRTSEDVAASLEEGLFGMVRETADDMNMAITQAAREKTGMGKALGKKLLDLNPPYVEYSLLAAGARLNIPVTVHTLIGGDTIHMHASADGAALGSSSFTDFRLLVSVLQDLGDGGVYLNIGSAVVLPEIFLKALNLARNLSAKKIKDFVTVNMDMIQHYRPQENVLHRPTLPGGKGFALTGHHEIMLPLLFDLILSGIAPQGT